MNNQASPVGYAIIVDGTQARWCGMIAKHFEAFRAVAAERNRVIVVRNTNPKAVPWIDACFPAKPAGIKAHTSEKTGIVTAKNRQEREESRAPAYYVVDDDLSARNSNAKVLPLPLPVPWPLEPGQIIEESSKRPFVGDYDVAGIFVPEDPSTDESKITFDEHAFYTDATSDEYKSIQGALNDAMGEDRVLHGPHDFFDGVPSTTCMVFWSRGPVFWIPAARITAFYDFLGRKGSKAGKAANKARRRATLH